MEVLGAVRFATTWPARTSPPCSTHASRSTRGLNEDAAQADVRPALSNDLVDERYKRSWGNELHPTASGFAAVAARFHQVLQAL